MKKKDLINSYSWYIHYYKKPFSNELYDQEIKNMEFELDISSSNIIINDI